MEKLFEKYIQKLQTVSTEFTRSIIHEINWKARLIGIKGALGKFFNPFSPKRL